MRPISFIAIMLLSTSLLGQKMFQEKRDGCSPNFKLEDQSILLEYNTGDSLLIVDILKGAEKKHIQRLKGVLAAQIILDSAGTPCLISYDYRFNMIRKPFEIVKNINSLQNWEGTGDNTFISVFVKLYFEKKQIVIQRLGYNRNSGWTILSQATFFKEEPEEEKKNKP